MWLLDLPEHDPDSNYSEPSAKQLPYAEQARRELAHLKRTLQRLTVPQQRAILGTIKSELVGGVYRRTPLRLYPHQKVTTVADARQKQRRVGSEMSSATKVRQRVGRIPPQLVSGAAPPADARVRTRGRLRSRLESSTLA